MVYRHLLLVCAAPFALSSAAAETDWHRDALAKAVAFHAMNPPKTCNALESSPSQPISYNLPTGNGASARGELLIEFPCQAGAYNQTKVYLLSNRDGGLSNVEFPMPKIDVTYVGEGENAPVKNVAITATEMVREVANPLFDTETLTLTAKAKWRGVGDTYTLAKWSFRNARFELVYFAVDASFDGRDDPQIMIDEKSK
ncbi:DUF1176 domain-containing protein [Shinella sedimenti]|uniref:DUF1176 domain-containing protein n=1 Tax=Shinella sedimenti TaxID=2919913 RepID=A0ABT0CT45_9HYPH|nr:DUF1176 domain-containing protein [Shinella sedimenti]MCJ8151758.1 DUF1176 domain-containing protein [Shinella sedimenti]